MVISTDAIAAVSTLRLSALPAVSSVSVAKVVAGTDNSAASVVDVSSLSQTLATTIALMEQEMKAIATSGSSASIGDAATSFSTTASLANMFVQAFNTFQNGNVNSIQDPLTSFLDSSLLDAMGGVLVDSGNNLLQSLSQIGITLNASTGADSIQFTLDSSLLQTAFTNAPVATATLLTQALQALAQIETALITQNQNLVATETGAGASTSTDSVSITNASATVAGVVASGVTPAMTTNLFTQETPIVSLADVKAMPTSGTVQNNVSVMVTAKQMSASSGAVNISPSSLSGSDVTAFSSGNNAVTQRTSALDSTAVNSLAETSVTTPDHVTTMEAQAQTVLADEVLNGLFTSEVDFIQTGLTGITGNDGGDTAASSLLSASVNNVMNSVNSSQELATVLVQPASMNESIVMTRAGNSLNDVNSENTSITNASLFVSDAASSGFDLSTSTTAAAFDVNDATTSTVSGVAASLLALPGGMNPAISAAVAAYKMGDAVVHQGSEGKWDEEDEVVFGNEIPPVTMDLKQHASEQRANETKGNKKTEQAKNTDTLTDSARNAQAPGGIDMNA